MSLACIFELSPITSRINLAQILSFKNLFEDGIFKGEKQVKLRDVVGGDKKGNRGYPSALEFFKFAVPLSYLNQSQLNELRNSLDSIQLTAFDSSKALLNHNVHIAEEIIEDVCFLK
jgi:hypothetical protein